MRLQIPIKIVFLLVCFLTGASATGASQPATIWDLRSFYPGNPDMLAWYINDVNGQEEGLWYQWTSDRDFRMNHQYGAPSPLNPCTFDEMTWGDDELWYGATIDTCTQDEIVTRYAQGVRYMPRYWTEGTQPTNTGTTEWVQYRNGIKTDGGTYTWHYQIIGWEAVTPEIQGIHIKVWGEQSWTYPNDWCCSNYEEHWWLGTRDGQPLILRSVGGTNGIQWDIWHNRWYSIEASSFIPLPKAQQFLFPMSAKTVERIIQRYSKQALGFVISWHSLRTTYVSRSVELEQSPAVVMINTGDSPVTILKYYKKLPEVVMRRFVEAKPVIPQ